VGGGVPLQRGQKDGKICGERGGGVKKRRGLWLLKNVNNNNNAPKPEEISEEKVGKSQG